MNKTIAKLAILITVLATSASAQLSTSGGVLCADLANKPRLSLAKNGKASISAESGSVHATGTYSYEGGEISFAWNDGSENFGIVQLAGERIIKIVIEGVEYNKQNCSK